MKLVRRHLAGLAAVLLVAVGVLLILFALDVRTWQRTVQRDDLVFRALPDHAGLWKPNTILPGDPAGAAIGTGDTIAWRRATQYFWFTRIGSNPDVQEDLPRIRATDAAWLGSLASSGATAHERSAATNLLGVLTVSTPVPGNDQNVLTKVLEQAALLFQTAIAIDPSNADAKQNLELVLRIKRPGKGKVGRDARAGFGFGIGHGAAAIGNGY
jgi:hypothetical protein